MYVLFSHLTGQKGGLPPTTHLVLPLYRLLALLEQVHLSFLRGQGLMARFGADCSVVPFPEMLLDGAVQ